MTQEVFGTRRINMTAKTITQTAVGLGSLSLVAHSSKMLKDTLKNKQPKPIRLVKGFVGLTLGTALLTGTAESINKL